MKSRLTSLGVVSLLLVAGCGADAPAEQVGSPLCERIGGIAAVLPLPADLATNFDSVALKGMDATEAVGATIAIQCGDSPIYVAGYGEADASAKRPAQRETTYEIGSISKQFIAAMVIELAGESRLNLSDEIGHHLSGLPARWQSVTLAELLSHTGGIPDHFAIFNADPQAPLEWTREHTPRELVDAFVALDDRLVAPPGDVFSYSNTGYVMLAAVIEAVTEQPFDTALEQTLFRPLEFDNIGLCSPSLPNLAVGYSIGPDGRPIPSPPVPAWFFSGAAGLCSTAGELVAWERHLFDGTAIDITAVREMTAPAVLADGSVAPYGFGLHLDSLGGREAIFHEGGTVGFSSWLVYYPDQDLILAVLMNTLGPNAEQIRDLVLDLTDVALG